MSTDPHESGISGLPENSDVSFETRDISISSVLWSLFYLAITVFVSLAICLYFFKFSTNYAASHDTPRPIVRQQMSAEDEKRMLTPQAPLMQATPQSPNDAQQDMRDKMAADIRANETLAWVDKEKGIAQIPVAEAMKIIAEKGAVPAAPAEKKQ